ncbi:unnamed protein product [Symbiodinium natans]|uniref:Spen paralogue and orthologue SPOC C-terminal domain-containing protein n=1 Tax=Symbiodinium natans TaxID=878477 RepID=A0A812TN84_9DINO|nr:unnamed protein product [Symbiodinium natans]
MALASSSAGVSCRVWLPDSVLAAGAKLKEALEGTGSANIEHLRRKHLGAKFNVKGQPSTEPAPWRRLHVVVTCPNVQMLAKAEADVVDLCETACDVAADLLGLTDDQVQDAFEKIRVERQESTRIDGAHGAQGLMPPLPTPMPPLFPMPFANSLPMASNSLWPEEAHEPQVLPSASASGLWAPDSVDTPSTSLLGQQVQGLGTTPKSTAPSAPTTPTPPTVPTQLPPRPKVRGVPAAFAVRLPRTVEPVVLPTPPAAMPCLPMTPSTPVPVRSAPLRMMDASHSLPPPLTAPYLGPLAAAIPSAPPPPPVNFTPSPSPSTATAAPPGGHPHTLDAHLEVARLAQAWLDRGSRRSENEKSRKRARTRLESDPYLVRENLAEDPYVVMLKEANAEDGTASAPVAEDSLMPPPSSVVAHKRKAKMQTVPGPETVSQEAVMVDGESSKSNSSASESESDSEGDESEEPEDDEVEEIEDMPVASVPSTGAKVGSEALQAPEEKLQLYKLGAKCCDVAAHFVGGSETALPESRRLDIDQRVRLEHCRRHLQWAENLTTVWHFSLLEPREKDAWAALRNYFVSRKRVGLAEMPRSVVYIVPPDQEFLSELGLPSAAESLAGSLLGLQVPLYQSENGEQLEDRASQVPDTSAEHSKQPAESPAEPLMQRQDGDVGEDGPPHSRCDETEEEAADSKDAVVELSETNGNQEVQRTGENEDLDASAIPAEEDILV